MPYPNRHDEQDHRTTSLSIHETASYDGVCSPFLLSWLRGLALNINILTSKAKHRHSEKVCHSQQPDVIRGEDPIVETPTRLPPAGGQRGHAYRPRQRRFARVSPLKEWNIRRTFPVRAYKVLA